MNKVNSLALAVSLAIGSQAAYALNPWTDKTPDLIVYTSGGAAQDKAYEKVVTTTLAAPGTVDIFTDVDSAGTVGGRWSAYYFTGNSNLPAGLAGKKILLEKRIYGAAGYGVVPLLASSGNGIAIEHLNIVSTLATDWVANGTQSWKQTITSSNVSKFIKNVVSDGGFLGVDPSILLKPGTVNYPVPVNTLTTGAPETKWDYTLKAIPTTGGTGFTVLPTGGLVYGVAVTADLYKVLQAAEKRAGVLPATVTIGNYDEASLPSLNRNVLASLLAGKVGAWDQIKIVDKQTSTLKSLLDPSILTDAGVTAPDKETATGQNLTPVAVGKRNNGAAVGAVAYATLLNYPSVASAFPPANTVPNTQVDESASLPIVKAPGGAADTGNLLKDWQGGTNTTGYNNVVSGSGYAKRWGIAVNSADRNSSVTSTGTGGDGWRYIKVDGYAPTLENVAAATYPLWAEGTVIFRTTKSTDKAWANKVNLLTALAKDLGSPAVANLVNTTQAWGKTGVFATTKDPRGFTTSIPFNTSSPVVALTHNSDGTTHADVVPVADSNATGGLSLQLK